MKLKNFNLTDYLDYLAKHNIQIVACNEDEATLEMIALMSNMDEQQLENLGKIVEEYVKWHPKAAA